ncbi:MAG: DUF4340 domain-containing protein [Verrucomicrobia bacterium]|nr:DUF4340 domain-containing protein [Verrucomicrobiota bacterium]
MKLRTTLVLFIAVLVVGAALWVSDRNRRTERDNVQLGSPLVTWQPNGVIGLELEAEGLQLVLRKQDGQWFLQSPVRARADGGQVERILSVLEALTREEIVTPLQRTQRGLALSDYGLEEPRARWMIVEEGRRQELEVGIDAPLGALTYVRLGRGRDVIATAKVLGQLVPTSVNALRDARILSGTPERVSRIELHRAGRSFVRLARQDGIWLLRQPVEGRADAGLVQALIDQLFTLRAETFVTDGAQELPLQPAIAAPPPAGVPDGVPLVEADPRLEKYGLAEDEAAARIQVWMDGDLVAYELVIGKPAGEADGSVYAARRDVDAIYTIQAAQLDWLTVSEEVLRERDVFGLAPSAITSVRLRQGERKLELARDTTGVWSMVDPWQGAADQQAVSDLMQGVMQWQTEAFVDGPETNAALHALTNIFCTLWLGTARVAAGVIDPTVRAWDGDGDSLRIARVTGVVQTVYARFDSSPELLRLSPIALQALGTDPLDPLLYRDRIMLSVPADDVQRMTLTKGAITQTVTRVDGPWRATPETNEVARAVIEDTLFFVSNLRALRAVAINSTNAAAYGLDGGATTLTLGLKGEQGILKTIVLGAPAGAEGRYAMVKGQDVVFTLTNAVVELLARNLYAPP